MGAGRPTQRPARTPRRLTEGQVCHRLQAMLDEIAALGGAYQLTAGQIRWRCLLLQQVVQELLDRWPHA
jgi:hypothetical protein